ncbi:MAG: pyridine nucleotide-disulfide oxidoreductase, partial [Nocardioides sp.]
LGHELCAPVDVERRLRDAVLHSASGTPRERSHVHAVDAHVRGDSRPLVAHLASYPRDALLLSVAVPTIAFAGVTEVPEEAWSIVERAAPAYGDDWWFAGLLAFIRQEQSRFDEAMELSCRSLNEERGAGHSAHARAHAHYETGDHAAGLSWMDDWVTGDGAATESLTHFSWHAALHELSLGDLDAVRRRYDAQLLPNAGLGCRALVDSGSLLFRWAITPGATDVPDLRAVAAVTDRELLERPATPFVAMHAAVAMLAIGDRAGLVNLTRWAAGHAHPVHREVVAPLGTALQQMADARYSEAADALARLGRNSHRLGGSDAQREILEETRICALLRADRYDEARRVLDARLDRRRSPRDERWRAECRPAVAGAVRPERSLRP